MMLGSCRSSTWRHLVILRDHRRIDVALGRAYHSRPKSHGAFFPSLGGSFVIVGGPIICRCFGYGLPPGDTLIPGALDRGWAIYACSRARSRLYGGDRLSGLLRSLSTPDSHLARGGRVNITARYRSG